MVVMSDIHEYLTMVMRDSDYCKDVISIEMLRKLFE